jgi:two-component system alkaline phosphatase synthesis response regulator PhoP
VDKKKILIADDEPTIRVTVRKMLDKDYIVVEATNGEEAIDIARGQRPDVILMDIMMPKMDGYTACSGIKADQDLKMIPVVMLTAVGHELNKKLAMEMGAEGYITKPFSYEELLHTVECFLRSAPAEKLNGVWI